MRNEAKAEHPRSAVQHLVLRYTHDVLLHKLLNKQLHRGRGAVFIAMPTAQVAAYLGGKLPQGASLWSKAGCTLWTGDPLASYRRHDLAHVKLASGARFTLAVVTQGQAIVLDETFLPGIGRLACELVGATPP